MTCSWRLALEDYLHADVSILRNEKVCNERRIVFGRSDLAVTSTRLGHGSAIGPGCGGVGAGSESPIVGNEVGGISGSSKDPNMGRTWTGSTPRGGTGAKGPGGAGGAGGARDTAVPAAGDLEDVLS